MSPICPRIVVAGTSSGVGKTSISLALVQALKKRGLKVQPFKIGPDFLDPTYLSLASGRDCYNLDGWMSGKEYLQELFVRETATADIAVIEGVMGLFDGVDPKTSEGSSAEIARLISAPILLAVNARGMARSIAAIVKGFCELEKEVNIAGVIANHCGSAKHREYLSSALLSADLPPLLGAVPKGAFPELPSRHLGLVTAGKGNLNAKILDKLAFVLEENVDIDKIIRLAKGAKPLQFGDMSSETLPKGRKVKLGIAYDDAFHFYYADSLKKMEQLGCELVRFSPLKAETIPKGLDGIYIGGGYPEEYAQTLSANRPMLEAVKQFANSGRPLYAECGGLVYLSQGIETLDGKYYPLASVLPTGVKMRKKFKHLGYVEVTLTADTIIGVKGDTLKGHRFHYSELDSDPLENREWSSTYSLKTRRTGETVREGFSNQSVLTSYVHAHLASNSEALKKFIISCGGN